MTTNKQNLKCKVCGETVKYNDDLCRQCLGEFDEPFPEQGY